MSRSIDFKEPGLSRLPSFSLPDDPVLERCRSNLSMPGSGVLDFVQAGAQAGASKGGEIMGLLAMMTAQGQPAPRPAAPAPNVRFSAAPAIAAGAAGLSAATAGIARASATPVKASVSAPKAIPAAPVSTPAAATAKPSTTPPAIENGATASSATPTTPAKDPMLANADPKLMCGFEGMDACTN